MFQIGLKKLSFGQKNKLFLQFIGSNHGMLAERERIINTDDLLSKVNFFGKVWNTHIKQISQTILFSIRRSSVPTHPFQKGFLGGSKADKGHL